MFSMPGGSEWLLILMVVMIVLGGKKIPEMMEGLGKGIRSFKKAMNEPDEPLAQALDSKAEGIRTESRSQ
jgi:sec-independent protein translocase protein TatA